MKKGFTLIELLIVITILAILAGAAVPYVQDYVEDARIAKCREDLGELRNAIMRYEVERNKLFDPENDGVGTTAAEKLKNWQQMLVGPFLTQALTDPWGRPYYFSHAA
ncbi:MAG: prepilin-type N-terminal cleavage/methylation domain-containing protein, partial [Candidatus Riflebacteria bacterium]|nr:prepilin-type N-terminal cleavage/methylation domain-containing protein [Candidatus Riflebacteria bacterium]